MKTVSRKDLISKVKEKGWELHRGEKSSPEEENQELLNAITTALDDLKRQLEVNALQGADDQLTFTDILSQIAKSQKAKKIWNMEVIRDSEGLIQSVIARQV